MLLAVLALPMHVAMLLEALELPMHVAILLEALEPPMHVPGCMLQQSGWTAVPCERTTPCPRGHLCCVLVCSLCGSQLQSFCRFIQAAWLRVYSSQNAKY
jgi:hypothetical protein